MHKQWEWAAMRPSYDPEHTQLSGEETTQTATAENPKPAVNEEESFDNATENEVDKVAPKKKRKSVRRASKKGNKRQKVVEDSSDEE
jgi:hypothetical protein